MARVEEWIGEFIEFHTARCPRQDWPPGDAESDRVFWDAWRYQFVIKGVTFDLVDEASRRLAGQPPQWLGDHLPSLLKSVAEIVKDRAERTGGEKEDPLKEASKESRDCLDCSGTGWATRFVHENLHGRFRTATDNPVPVGGSFAIPCGCPYGRQVAAAAGRRLTVADYPSLRLDFVEWSDVADNAYRYRPEPLAVELAPPRRQAVAVAEAVA